MRFSRADCVRLPLMAVLVCAVTACGGSRARFDSHLKRGQDFLAAGNIEKANVEFRNAAQIQPKSPVALYYLGRVAESRSNIRDAYGFFQAAIDANTGYVPAMAEAGKMLVFAGAAKRALDTVAPGLAAHPDDPDLLSVRAAAHQQLNERDAALADAERAVAIAPTNENAVAVRAAIYAADKDYPHGIALVDAALAKSPTSTNLREILTNLYLASGQFDLAQQQMRKIVELRPQDLAVRVQLARFLMNRHDLDGAQQVLEQAVQALNEGKQAERADEAKLLLVDFLSRERSRQQGEEVLRKYIAREPDNLDLRLGLGALYQRTGAPADALAAYSEVVKRDGTGAKGLAARNRMASIEMAQGHLDRVRKLVAEVLQKNPRDDDALILRSTLASRENDPTSAIGDLRAVLRNQPNSVPLLRSLAAAYVATGQPALAEEALRAALRAAPKDIPTRIELSKLLFRTERADKGVELLEETVAGSPDSFPAREALLQAYLESGNLRSGLAAAEELKTRQPQSAAGFYYAGLIAERQKRLQDGQSNLEKAYTLEPKRIDVLTALLRVQLEHGGYDAAVDRAQAALAQSPDNLGILDLLGAMYLDHKDWDRAGETFARMSTLNPSLWQPHRGLAQVKLARNDVPGALQEYKAALALAPTDAQLVADAARVYEQHGHADEAIAHYETLYKGNKQSRQFAANNLAMLLVTYRKDQASLDRARELTSGFETSTNGTLLDTAGWVRFKRGEYRDALGTLERAVERSPASKVIRFHLGMDQLQLGMRDRARSTLESALNGTDSFEGADEARLALAELKTRA